MCDNAWLPKVFLCYKMLKQLSDQLAAISENEDRSLHVYNDLFGGSNTNCMLAGLFRRVFIIDGHSEDQWNSF